MIFFSWLVSENFILASVCLGLWAVSPKEYKKISFLALLSALSNYQLKDWFQLCRPPESLHLIQISGYSFPSGHAQLACTVWLSFLFFYQHFVKKIICFFTICLICISRCYLGVHYFHDVAAGFAIGSIFFFLGQLNLYSPLKLVVKNYPSTCFFGLTSFFIYWGNQLPSGSDFTHWRYLGAICGWLFLFIFIDVSYSVLKIRLWKQTILIILGYFLTIGLRSLLFHGFEILNLPRQLGDFLRYFLLIYWIMYLYPQKILVRFEKYED